MNSKKWTLVRGARQLLTLHSHSGARRGPEAAELAAIPDGSVLLRDGLIEAVGPTKRIENMAAARQAQEINAAGRVVLPAFIDAHAVVSPVPGSGPTPSRLVNAIPATRLEAQADRLLRTMARHGTGSVASLTGYGGGSTGELKILRALHARAGKPLDIEPVLQISSPQMTGDAAQSACELMEIAIRRKLAAILALCSGAGALGSGDAVRFMDVAQRLGYAIRLQLLPEHDPKLATIAAERNALSIASNERYRIEEIEALIGASTFAILLPSKVGPEAAGSARALIDGGALVALGSGLDPENGGTASMQTVIRDAFERCGLSIGEAICGATVNAAWAIGMGRRTGSLEHGKYADLLLLNVSDYREIPLYPGTNLVHAMIKRGAMLYQEEFPGWPAAVQS
jgi:imidazolonepropionase